MSGSRNNHIIIDRIVRRNTNQKQGIHLMYEQDALLFWSPKKTLPHNNSERN